MKVNLLAGAYRAEAMQKYNVSIPQKMKIQKKYKQPNLL